MSLQKFFQLCVRIRIGCDWLANVEMVFAQDHIFAQFDFRRILGYCEDSIEFISSINYHQNLPNMVCHLIGLLKMVLGLPSAKLSIGVLRAAANSTKTVCKFNKVGLSK